MASRNVTTWTCDKCGKDEQNDGRFVPKDWTYFAVLRFDYAERREASVKTKYLVCHECHGIYALFAIRELNYKRVFRWLFDRRKP